MLQIGRSCVVRHNSEFPARLSAWLDRKIGATIGWSVAYRRPGGVVDACCPEQHFAAGGVRAQCGACALPRLCPAVWGRPWGSQSHPGGCPTPGKEMTSSDPRAQTGAEDHQCIAALDPLCRLRAIVPLRSALVRTKRTR
ncbi:hypothetical protein PsYK624_148030 [Phanerochaete sordida]|uniref:Uncharacterized protein n=1 Tax=Phanerochaete sordida TaxID=48140 RepID=A0A9P3GN92_9APHY|nr:hypothetical protein PsYK624_148030 [Phanerochaete sordida]